MPASHDLHELPQEVERLTPELIALRRDLHRHPELAFREQRTAGIVAQRLQELGLRVRTGVGGTGVVALLVGDLPGPVVAIRADMDALPLTETAETPYRSQTPGAMHACGHDGHTASVLIAAKLLASRRSSLTGSVKFLFQPAEETANGAEAMIRDGAMRDPPVSAILGVHLWNNQPVGTIGLREGAMWASVDELKIVIRGKGGHGAMPHQTIDPVPIAAHIVLALGNLVARETAPLEPIALTIGSIHAGAAFNVIPGEVTMLGTLRTFSMPQRDALVMRIEETVRGICLAMRAEGSVVSEYLTPPVVNDAAITALVRQAALTTVGEHRIVAAQRSMTGDDVAFLHKEAPGCYILIGSGNAAKGFDKPHHHPRFDFDEAALPVAVEVLTRSALACLERRAG
ncbi:MAG: amidohydrolase [Dehalococcoidia bacterium]|nr:amidohydrolase [Dehalococcoidia bacterium]